jgi:hypothetical protein
VKEKFQIFRCSNQAALLETLEIIAQSRTDRLQGVRVENWGRNAIVVRVPLGEA